MDEVNKDTEFINILNKSAEDYILTKGYTNLILDNSKLEITIKEKNIHIEELCKTIQFLQTQNSRLEEQLQKEKEFGHKMLSKIPLENQPEFRKKSVL